MRPKHFDALAAALHAAKPQAFIDPMPALWQWQLDCERVADACALFNSNFNRARFLGACEGDGHVQP